MTRIKVFRSHGKITRFEAQGHSGYAEEGGDIVCSAVSALTQAAVAGLLEIAALAAEYTVGDGSICCQLPQLNAHEREKADMILETMLLGLRAMQEDYGEYLKITEREV